MLHSFQVIPIRPAETKNLGPRPRKSHPKSRFGCNNCKTRKVKCDEAKPSCNRCTARSVKCDYADQSPKTKSSREVPTSLERAILPTPSPHLTISSLSNSLSAINQQVSRQGAACQKSKLCTFDLELLHHFESQICSTIAGPTVQRVYRQELVRIAVNHVYLLDVILATALLHRQILSSSQNQLDPKLSHHWRQCLSGFANCLSQGIADDNADAMLASATLINGLAFALVEPRSRSEIWPLTSHDGDLSWLYIQRGVNVVYKALPNAKHDGAIRKLFDEPEKLLGTQCLPITTRNTEDFQRLVNLCACPSEKRKAYGSALKILASLQELDCTQDTILMHLGFLGSMTDAFISLLQARDHKALLIMGHWYAGVCNLDCWWVSRRSKIECAAICQYLDERADGDIRELLLYPSHASGYKSDYLGTQNAQVASSQAIPCTPM